MHKFSKVLTSSVKFSFIWFSFSLVSFESIEQLNFILYENRGICDFKLHIKIDQILIDSTILNLKTRLCG